MEYGNILHPLCEVHTACSRYIHAPKIINEKLKTSHLKSRNSSQMNSRIGIEFKENGIEGISNIDPDGLNPKSLYSFPKH